MNLLFDALLLIFSVTPLFFKGYGQFRVTLESLLTRSHTEQLATWFGYAPANIDRINRSDNPSRILVQFMDERGEISPTDISTLTEALKHKTIGLGGVSVKIEEAFENYRPMIDSTTVINGNTLYQTHMIIVTKN